MKITTTRNVSPPKFTVTFARVIVVASILFAIAVNAIAQLPPGAKTNATPYMPLDSWTFYDNTNWTNDKGYAPVSFTNLDFSNLGDGRSLVVDSDDPAWLQYNVVETNGTNNLTVDTGSVTFWFAPDWDSVSAGGTGPGVAGRLLEVGGYTSDSSFGWWSLYFDENGDNIYFSAQTNDLSSTATTYLSAPITWTTFYWHFITLTYCPTNTALYLDGSLVTNGLPLTVYPGTDVLSNSFFIGSDSNGVAQAHGMFNSIYTYGVPLDANTVQSIYNYGSMIYWMNPVNSKYMSRFASANSTPSSSTNYYQAISGIGSLQLVGAASSCVTSTNVWLTNLVSTIAANGTVSVMFTIEGGSDGVPYDVFANSILAFGTNGFPWTWMGQGYHCNTYILTNLPSGCFLILGTPQDSDGDGLTDAFELLDSKTDPNNAYSNLDGLLDSWEVLLGLNPKQSNFNNPAVRSNYSYDSADWLEGLSGVRSGAISLDAEGNVTQVSQ
ncbi:MAG TPA: LamG-like jellyroll fold domain-containing protein [Methylomirabilota bacterium]|nr:LamG-like jellyroll fold domain-containing protein [Methylomirabilota bacterium]